MIDASFNMRSRSAAVSGAYQYDTGQRIRLHGLPSPEELAEQDDFLSGDVVTVQAQYSYVGDSQTEARLASWDEDNFVWTAAVPDAFMQRSEDVHVYVYVSYGANEESSRAKTCYEAVFRPISRPAPSTQTTPDQLSAWDQLVAEVNLALTEMNTAISGANAAAASTNQAIQNAKTATQNAQSAADQIDGMSVEAKTLSYNSSATATITDTDGGKRIVFGIPKGKPGVFTLNGKTPDANGAVTLTAADVGALTSAGTAANATKLSGKTLAEIVLAGHPVGSLYISTSSASPASLFGGTWEQIKDRFLLAAGSTYSAGSTGGSATRKITVENLPVQTIVSTQNTSGASKSADSAGWGTESVSSGEYFTTSCNWLETNGFISDANKAISTVPPYVAVYVWKRVS